MYGSEAFEGLLKGDLRPRLTIQEVFLNDLTTLRGIYGFGRVLVFRKNALRQLKAAIYDI